MVDRAALQVTPVGDAHHHRAREGVAGAPPQSGELVAELMVGGPDVVEELDLHHGLQAASREADGAAHDVRLGDRKSTRLNSSHLVISYAVFCLKKKTTPASTAPCANSSQSSTATAPSAGLSRDITPHNDIRSRFRLLVYSGRR